MLNVDYTFIGRTSQEVQLSLSNSRNNSTIPSSHRPFISFISLISGFPAWRFSQFEHTFSQNYVSYVVFQLLENHPHFVWHYPSFSPSSTSSTKSRWRPHNLPFSRIHPPQKPRFPKHDVTKLYQVQRTIGVYSRQLLHRKSSPSRQ